jgi:hypothetical protein
MSPFLSPPPPGMFSDEELATFADPNYDGAPYCSYGHRSAEHCDCEPIADNE